jgi:hypothetical protein
VLDRVKIRGERRLILEKGNSLLKEPNYNFASNMGIDYYGMRLVRHPRKLIEPTHALSLIRIG